MKSKAGNKESIKTENGSQIVQQNKIGNTESEKASKGAKFFSKLSNSIMKFTGSPTAFLGAAAIIIIWVVVGPVFKFSDTWQLVINTGTTIITFLMVFIIQQSQNKDTMALHLKLNELLAANKDASNRLVSAEDMTESELEVLKRFYTKLSSLAKEENKLRVSHSIDEAENIHAVKTKSKEHQKGK